MRCALCQSLPNWHLSFKWGQLMMISFCREVRLPIPSGSEVSLGQVEIWGLWSDVRLTIPSGSEFRFGQSSIWRLWTLKWCEVDDPFRKWVQIWAIFNLFNLKALNKDKKKSQIYNRWILELRDRESERERERKPKTDNPCCEGHHRSTARPHRLTSHACCYCRRSVTPHAHTYCTSTGSAVSVRLQI